jgi:hypothetical protein
VAVLTVVLVFTVNRRIGMYTGYFTSDNEPGGIENATYNTSGGKAGFLSPPCPGLRSNVLWVAFFIPPGSFGLVQAETEIKSDQINLYSSHPWI